MYINKNKYAYIKTWIPKQPCFDGCLVKQQFLYVKKWNHPIEPFIKTIKMGCGAPRAPGWFCQTCHPLWKHKVPNEEMKMSNVCCKRGYISTVVTQIQRKLNPKMTWVSQSCPPSLENPTRHGPAKEGPSREKRVSGHDHDLPVSCGLLHGIDKPPGECKWLWQTRGGRKNPFEKWIYTSTFKGVPNGS